MSRASSLHALVLVGLVTALNGFVLAPWWMLDGAETFSQTAGSGSFAVSQRISWLLLTALVVTVPALASDVRGKAGTTWLVPLAQVALTAQAATAFAMGFVAPWLSEVAPATLDRSGGTFQLAMTAVWFFFIASMLVFALGLRRTGHIGRAATALVVLGSLVIPGAGPVGVGLLGVGLAVAARAQLRASEEPATSSHSSSISL